MKKNRDDFTPKTKRGLRRRAGSRCSNPDCRVPTDGPSDEGPDKINNIGKAAHITAAAPGGPRYNSGLKPDERRSINNGIWLCANCADLIDNDEKTYTVALLHEWKKKAEERAKREQGKKLPDEHDAVNTLVAAATGQTGVFLPSLMSNASKAASGYLEGLDQRFTVKTSYSEGVTQHIFHSKEDIQAKLYLSQDRSEEFFEKLKLLRNYGQSLAIDSKAFTDVDGLPVLKKLLTDTSKIQLTPSRKSVLIRSQLISPCLRKKSVFCNLHGSIVFAKKEISIKAKAFDGLISISISIPTDNFNCGRMSFELNFRCWDKIQLIELPYFDKIYELYCKINSGWNLKFLLDIEDLDLLSSHIADYVKDEFFFYEFNHLHFISSVKKISKILGHSLSYDKDFKYNQKFFWLLKDIGELLEKGQLVVHPAGLVIKTRVGRDVALTLKDQRNKKHIGAKFNAKYEQICPFNQIIDIPEFTHVFTELVTNVIIKERHDNNVTDLVDIELTPTDNCKYIVEKLSDARSN